LLARAVALELLRALALCADAGFLLSAVQAARRVATIVPARVVRRLAPLRAGGVAADRLRALPLLAFAQRALRILALRLRLLCLHAGGVAAGAATRLLDALGLLALRLLALGGQRLPATRILVALAAERALAFGRVLAGTRLLLLRLVATARFLGALAPGLFAHAALALVGRGALLLRALRLRWRWLGPLRRLGLRLLLAHRFVVLCALRGGGLATRRAFGATRLLAALLARVALAAAAVLRGGGKRARQRETEDQRVADEDSGGEDLLHRCRPMPTNRSAQG